MYYEHNSQYLVNEPTRITTISQTILDQILTNAQNFVSDVSVLPPLSTNDDCTVGARVNLKIHKKAAYWRHVWLYKQANFDLFRAGLSDADFDEVFALDHIDDICKAWTEKFLSIAKLFIPNREILVRPSDSPWYCSKFAPSETEDDEIISKVQEYQE